MQSRHRLFTRQALSGLVNFGLAFGTCKMKPKCHVRRHLAFNLHLISYLPNASLCSAQNWANLATPAEELRAYVGLAHPYRILVTNSDWVYLHFRQATFLLNDLRKLYCCSEQGGRATCLEDNSIMWYIHTTFTSNKIAWELIIFYISINPLGSLCTDCIML
jgi:hypothetical protein